MSRNERQLLDPPAGMASYYSETNLPENRCQLLRGFLPARYGTQRQAPQLRSCLTLPWDIVGIHPYYSSDGLHDKLVIIRSNPATVGQLYTTPLTGAFSYNAYNGKQHVKLTLATPTLVGSLQGVATYEANLVFAVPVLATRAIQFNDELIIFDATPTAVGATGGTGAMLRYYVNSSGVEQLHAMGMYTGFSITAPGITDGGAGGVLSAGTYKYAVVQLDERGREGTILRTDSAGNDLDITLAVGHKVAFAAGILASATYNVNIYRTVANGAVYLLAHTLTTNSPFTDNIADVDLGAAMPEIGENDPPKGATFGASYKDRLVINSRQTPPNGTYFPAGNVGGNQIIQISNAGSPTQFSVISLPTNPADGLTIGAGTSTGDQVTGLANLGSLLAVFMGRSIKLLQGQDGTDFELIEIHKRGAINHDSIQRTENVIPFLSNDGVYEIAYGSGIQDRKISLDIQDFFFGDADTVGNGNESDLVKRIMAAATAGSLMGWYWDNIYFLSLPMQTICYDLVSEGWSQTGWSLISNACVYTQPGSPQACFVLPRTNASTKPRQIYWFSDMQQTTDPDALPTSDCTEITRLFDGEGVPSERVKKLIRFSLWGSSEKPNGTVIGDLVAYTDQGYQSEAFPIVVGQVVAEASALFEQEFPDEAVGRHIWFKIHITDPSYIGSDRMAIYSSYDVNG